MQFLSVSVMEVAKIVNVRGMRLTKESNQQFSSCVLQPLWQNFISKNIYITIHKSVKITVIKQQQN